MSDLITLITGTRKGIGKYLAQYYVEQGHHVIGCSRTQPEWTLANYQHFNLDVSDETAVKEMFCDIKKIYGQLDNLINNAGIAAMNHSLLTPLTTVQTIINTNLIGTFLFCREAAKLMQKKQHGRIVNFTTVAVPLQLEGEAIYAASKAAIITLTQILARELAPYQITVNVIGPTAIDTDLTRTIPEQKINELLQRQAIKKKSECKDVANIIDFFISEKSRYVTGQTIYLGGVA